MTRILLPVDYVGADGIAPREVLTWSEVYSVSGTAARIRHGVYHPGQGRVVFWRGTGGGSPPDRAALAHSAIGSQQSDWTIVGFGEQSSVNVNDFHKIVERGGSLYLLSGFSAAGELWQTLALISFVQVGADFGVASENSMSIVKCDDGTIFILRNHSTNASLRELTGATLTVRTSAPTATFTDVCEGHLNTIYYGSGAVLRRYNRGTNDWSTIFTFGTGIASLGWWQARQEIYIGLTNGDVFRYVGSGTPDRRWSLDAFNAMQSSQFVEIGRNLYIVAAGTYAGVNGSHLFRSPDSISLVYLGGFAVANQAAVGHYVVYHPGVNRFFMTGMDIIASTQKIFRSSVPVS